MEKKSKEIKEEWEREIQETAAFYTRVSMALSVGGVIGFVLSVLDKHTGFIF